MSQQPEEATQQRVIAGRYLVLEEIGRGGMGIVWLAEDRMIGRRVAIKELHLPAGVEPAERTVFEERVLREARTAGRLNDPGVVTVYDVLQESGGTFIVMELIEAPTLSAIVARQGPLPQEVVARLAEQLLSALEAAHAAGIVHRDVKPSNIMVLPNGRVKLTDFGIAQSTDDPRLTTSGILVGSPTYIAPERIAGAEADAGSDLWALGAVLFYAVEGNSPFERSSTAATMHAILNEVPFLTRGHGPLASVIMGLLNTTPAARPSVDQVRGLLAQAAMATASLPDGQSTSPLYANTARYPQQQTMVAARSGVNKPGRRRPVLVAGAAVLMVAALAGAVLITRALTGQEPERPANMDETLTYGKGGYIEELSWESYPEGRCLLGELTKNRRITSSAQVECTEAHDLQVFHGRTVFEKPGDYGGEPVNVAYPDAADLTRFAELSCTMAMHSAQVSGEDDDKDKALRYRALIPAGAEWDDSRGIYCVLYAADGGQLTDTRVEVTGD